MVLFPASDSTSIFGLDLPALDARSKAKADACRGISDILVSAGYKISPDEVLNGLKWPLTRDAINEFFARFQVAPHISEERWDAMCNQDGTCNDKDTIASAGDLLSAFQDLQKISAMTGVTLGRMMASTNIRYVDRAELVKIMKQIAGDARFKGNEKLMRFGITDGTTDEDALYYGGMGVIYNYDTGILAYLLNRKHDLNGLKLQNARVLREFKGIVEDFLLGSASTGQTPLEDRVDALKKREQQIERLETWLHAQEPKVSEWLRVKYATSTTVPYPLDLTSDDYANDEIWAIVERTLMPMEATPEVIFNTWSIIEGKRTAANPAPAPLAAAPAPRTNPSLFDALPGLPGLTGTLPPLNLSARRPFGIGSAFSSGFGTR